MCKCLKKKMIEVPKDITAMFVCETEEGCRQMIKALNSKRDVDYLITSGIKIIYRKDAWDIIQ